MTLKETLINTLVDSMSMEDLQQYVANDMADWLFNCSESEALNELFIKVKYTSVSYTHLTLPTTSRV